MNPPFDLDSILRTLDEGVILTDTAFKIIRVNQTIGKFFGIEFSETLPGLDMLEGSERSENFLTTIGFTRDSLMDASQTAQHSSANKVAQQLETNDGEYKWIERYLIPIRAKEPRRDIQGWMFLFREIEDREGIDKYKEDLTHMLIHDLRSPLVVLTGSLDLMNESVEMNNRSELEHLIQLAKRGSHRLLEEVNEILDISKLESGKLNIDHGEIDIPSVINDVISQFYPITHEFNIEVKCSFTNNLPKITGDLGLIHRVIFNLIDNAFKHTPQKGTIEVKVTLEPGKPRFIRLEVADEGPGVPPSKAGYIFSKYYQLEADPARRLGTGLGLAFCKLAVEAHHGQIWVENRDQRGGNFIVRLPQHQPHKNLLD